MFTHALATVTVVALSLLAPWASAPAVAEDKPEAKQRVLVATKVAGRAGERITCFAVDEPRDCAIVFRGDVPKLVVEVVRTAKENAKDDVLREASNDGDLPLINARLRRVTIEFREAGSCTVEIVQMSNG